ncbi:hypothetical protein PVAP13_7NG396725 [Panicum virgatum]|uniref:Uncharacterized protein n=1 Tax=Panicum virgatum TaxID=38727 RepID=A0A8T0Q202_PANVG|nr:hypothetical protein PVAP13_7NG396725 [Panicum virgatum]
MAARNRLRPRPEPAAQVVYAFSGRAFDGVATRSTSRLSASLLDGSQSPDGCRADGDGAASFCSSGIAIHMKAVAVIPKARASANQNVAGIFTSPPQVILAFPRAVEPLRPFARGAARFGDLGVGFSVQFSPVIANITSFSQSTMICVFEIFIQVIRMPSPQPEYKKSE